MGEGEEPLLTKGGSRRLITLLTAFLRKAWRKAQACRGEAVLQRRLDSSGEEGRTFPLLTFNG